MKYPIPVKLQAVIHKVLGPILFLLFINDISNFEVEGCALNMYADDVIIYTSAVRHDST